MMKLIFLGLCLVAGASALLPWDTNPKLPSYPVFFLSSWTRWPYYCDTVYKDQKQCFEDCMNANDMGRYISDANKVTNPCPPTTIGCYIPWRRIACQCAKRCECKLGHCGGAQCLFCRR